MLRKTSAGFHFALSLFLVLLIAPSSIPRGKAYPAEGSESKYEVYIERDFKIPMRDGVELIADAYRPGKNGKIVAGQFPVILIRTDTDFTAKLIDVYPPSKDHPEGYAMNLADGIQRTHYRHRYLKAEMMKPGEVNPITIELFATSNLFQKNNCIRVDISSSDYPDYDPNPKPVICI
jgi:uncharacterized protein